jgi:hypothetical protein
MQKLQKTMWQVLISNTCSITDEVTMSGVAAVRWDDICTGKCKMQK